MTFISNSDPWYRTTDMNMHNLVDALAINASIAPNEFAQPAVPLKYLLALDYRVRHELGLLPVWHMKKLGASADPLREIPPLVRAERVHSRILVMLLILAAAGLVYSVTREVDAACLTVILFCGSAAVLFHGLLIRPELLCVGFGNVLALLCAWRATGARHWLGKHVWLFAAGLLGGLSALEKLPGVGFLALCYGWCWLSALIALAETPAPGAPPSGPGFWRGLVPALSGASVLWLLFQLAGAQEVLGPVAVERLRVAAVVTGALPLLALWNASSRPGRFLLDRCQELALLAAGALAVLPLAYLLLRGVMTESAAATYLSRALHFLVNPTPTVDLFLATKPDIGREFMVFFKEAPVLFVAAFAGAIGLCFLRPVPLRLKALVLLLLAGALAITLLLCRRYFSAQYSIFLQVPLLLALVLCLSGLAGWLRQRHPADGIHWTVPLTLAAALVFTLLVYTRLKPKYSLYHDDGNLPVSDLTLTFIFDHDAHPAAYLQIMRDHYGTRADFSATLQRYLADPANRY